MCIHSETNRERKLNITLNLQEFLLKCVKKYLNISLKTLNSESFFKNYFEVNKTFIR